MFSVVKIEKKKEFAVVMANRGAPFLLLFLLNFPIDIEICIAWGIINNEKLVY